MQWNDPKWSDPHVLPHNQKLPEVTRSILIISKWTNFVWYQLILIILDSHPCLTNSTKGGMTWHCGCVTEETPPVTSMTGPRLGICWDLRLSSYCDMFSTDLKMKVCSWLDLLDLYLTYTWACASFSLCFHCLSRHTMRPSKTWFYPFWTPSREQGPELPMSISCWGNLWGKANK